MVATSERQMTSFGMLTEMFRRNPSTDLRTPRATFDSFCRSVLTQQTATLWQTVHPQLRQTMRERYQSEGNDRFFKRMKDIISTPSGRLCLGQAEQTEPGKMDCPVLRNGRHVGTAHFSFFDRSWVLSGLN